MNTAFDHRQLAREAKAIVALAFRSIPKCQGNNGLGFPCELPVVESGVHLEVSSILRSPELPDWRSSTLTLHAPKRTSRPRCGCGLLELIHAGVRRADEF